MPDVQGLGVDLMPPDFLHHHHLLLPSWLLGDSWLQFALPLADRALELPLQADVVKIWLDS